MAYRNVRSYFVCALAMVGSLAASGCSSDAETFAVEQSSGLTARTKATRAEPCLAEWRAWDKANDAVVTCARAAEANETCAGAAGDSCSSCVGHSCSLESVRVSDTRRDLSSCLAKNGATLNERDSDVEATCGADEARVGKGDPTVGRGAGSAD
ncbi:MAG: hypothetical protein U0169_21100 [Polyangiaceae bacterium]